MHSHKTTAARARRSPVRHRLAAALLAAMALASTNAQAQDEGFSPSFTLRGFGTLGIAHSSEKEADFVAHDLQGGGAGRDHEWSADVDSKIGLQLNANLTSKLTAIVQAMAEQRYDGTYRPGLEWAFLKYDVTEDFSLRAGRSMLPILMTSETRKIGYAQPWVRPPVEMYSLIPVTSSNGLHANWRLRFGDVGHTIMFGYGGSDERHPEGGKIKIRDGWLISDTVDYGAATFHMSYTRTRVSIDPYAPLFDGYRQVAAGSAQTAAALGGTPFAGFAPQFNAASADAQRIIDKYDTDNTRMEVIAFGASYDPGDWFIMGEWGQAKSPSIFGKRQAWYTTAGYRWGNFTPYVTYARARLKSRDSDRGVTIPGLPFPASMDPDYQELVAGAAAANDELNASLAGAPKQRTISVGIRWDFAKNAALKLQYDYSNIGNGSTGTLDHQTDDFKYGKRFEVWSATLDFVF